MTSEPRNVALLCLDTVRADVFETEAPRLNRLADVSFRSCRAASSWSVPSHASILTGELPSEHGVHAFAPGFDQLATTDTFLGRLPDHRTVGVSANVYAGSPHGFDSHFDAFVDVDPKRRFPDGLDAETFLREYDGPLPGPVATAVAALRHDRPTQSLANAACLRLRDLTEHGDRPVAFDDGMRTIERAVTDRLDAEPWFLFVNAMDAHSPHRQLRAFEASVAPPEFRYEESDKPAYLSDPEAHTDELDRMRRLYRAAVRYLDRRVAALVEEMLAVTDRPTTVVVTADHGENLGTATDEHRLGHVGSLGEGLLHVPLTVINPPSGYPSSVCAPVSHLELGDLLVGLARGETPDVTCSHPVAEVLGMPPGNDDLVDVPPGDWDRAIRCVYDGTTKYCWDSLGSTSRVEFDPDRPCYQSPSEPVTVPDWAHDRFGESVTEARERAETEHTGERAETARARLRELGYL